MPVKRRLGKARREGASDKAWAFMLDEPMPEAGNRFRWLMWHSELCGANAVTNTARTSIREIWEAFGNEALAEWIKNRPGTRPRCWWAWDAPRQWVDGLLAEPRKRCGGIGTPASDVMNIAPALRAGVPTDWVTALDVESSSLWEGFQGFAISASDPPRFEAEATYLDRHGLLLPGERERILDECWRPVVVSPEGDDAG